MSSSSSSSSSSSRRPPPLPPPGSTASAGDVPPSVDAAGPSDAGRRAVLHGGIGAAAALLFAPLGGCSTAATRAGSSALGFTAVAASAADAVVVPPGYRATVLAPWGEPVGIAGAMPAWRPDASNTAAEQALQTGMHHDGMHYLALDGGRRGLLAINHEYTDDGLLHPGGMQPWTAAKVAKSQAAHGLSVIEVERADDRWWLVRPSRYARRITATTPCTIAGPAAAHALLKTAADPGGRRVLGTLANCGSGLTPWGTVLSGEENWANYFHASDQPTAHERRYGIRRGAWYRWHEHDPRFDTVRHPNEPNRFGWVVEVDPADPAAPPVKRTALGRAAHEGAWVAVAADGRAVVYSSEDAAFECIYKFVSRDRIRPGGGGLSAAQANAELLDHGTLYVARFDAGGSGRWLPLVHGQGPLTSDRGFADAGEVMIRLRQAADLVGGTPMDRPEWIAVDPRSGQVCCALTNNAKRGTPGHPGVDAANPREADTMGRIVRWREDGGDAAAETFRWEHLVLAGAPPTVRPAVGGKPVAAPAGAAAGDAFASPDTVAFDARGVLWIGTDVGPGSLNRGEMAPMGNNQLLACDPATGDLRRFLVGPVHAEITACTFTPDGTTMFVNVQHPGESPGGRSDPAHPARHSSWPDAHPGARPRSATLAIRRDDGGVVGG